MKHNPDGSIQRHKARLVAENFTQAYGVDYLETFLPVVKLNSISVILSTVTNFSWLLYQMDAKNAFSQWEFIRGSIYGPTTRLCGTRT